MLLVAKTYWGGAPFNFRQEPAEAEVAPLLLDTADHRQIQGLYWTPAGSPVPRVSVVCMHPRVDFTRHYSFPRLLAAGIGCATVQRLRHGCNGCIVQRCSVP